MPHRPSSRRAALASGAGLCIAALVMAACGSSRRATPATTTVATGASTSTSTSVAPNPTTTATRARPVCGGTGAAPRTYSSVVVFSFENRSWSSVGNGFASMPYLRSLAQRCTYFTDWTETDTQQNSLTQYIGQVTGDRQAGTVNDCAPSASCSTRADNLFRQARRAGLTAINYVEGARGGCDASGNAAKHVPALYLWGSDDRAHCTQQVRPYRELDPNALPSFAFVTPTLCHDGHDCGNDVVDQWARTNVGRVLASPAYLAGHVAVFIWYDEDRPVPNLWIAPTARPGPHSLARAGYAATLAAWESMLGLPCLATACAAPDMRATANA